MTLKQQGYFLPIIGLLFLLLLVSAGGYYFFFSRKTTSSPSLNPQNVPATSQPTPANNPSDISDWIIYEDKTNGFLFKHPSMNTTCCLLGGVGTGKAISAKTFAMEGTVREGTDAPFDGFSFSVVPIPANQTFTQYLDNEKQAITNINKTHEGYDSGKQQSLPIIIGGVTGTLLKGYTWYGAYHDLIYVPFPDGKKALEIDLLQVSDGSFQSVFDKILSTFKFTNQTSTNDLTQIFSKLSAENKVKTCNYYDNCFSDIFSDSVKREIASSYNVIDVNDNESTIYIGLSKGDGWHWEIGACPSNKRIFVDTITGEKSPISKFVYCGGVE